MLSQYRKVRKAEDRKKMGGLTEREREREREREGSREREREKNWLDFKLT